MLKQIGEGYKDEKLKYSQQRSEREEARRAKYVIEAKIEDIELEIESTSNLEYSKISADLITKIKSLDRSVKQGNSIKATFESQIKEFAEKRIKFEGEI